MGRRAEDVDWYVDMSERLERRERRRKWVALGAFVAVPLLLMGGFVGYMMLDRSGLLSELAGSVRTTPAERPAAAKDVLLGPVSVRGLHRGDIRFAQLDRDRLPTSITHFFREMLPDKAEVFTVNRESDESGTVLAYRLRNLGTGDVYEFADVRVKKVAGEWMISEEGWEAIRSELQAKMKVELARPTF